MDMKEYILLKSSCDPALMKFRINLCPDLSTVVTLGWEWGWEKGMGKGDARENIGVKGRLNESSLAGSVCAAVAQLVHSLITCTNNFLCSMPV